MFSMKGILSAIPEGMLSELTCPNLTRTPVYPVGTILNAFAMRMMTATTRIAVSIHFFAAFFSIRFDLLIYIPQMIIYEGASGDD